MIKVIIGNPTAVKLTAKISAKLQNKNYFLKIDGD